MLAGIKVSLKTSCSMWRDLLIFCKRGVVFYVHVLVQESKWASCMTPVSLRTHPKFARCRFHRSKLEPASNSLELFSKDMVQHP